MSLSRAGRWLTLFLTIGLLSIVPIAASAQTQADVDKAERTKAVAEARRSTAYLEYVAVSARLDEAVAEFQEISHELEDLLRRKARMEDAVSRYRSDATSLNESAKRIVIDAYTGGQTNMIGSAFAAASIQDLVTSQAVLDRATEAELSAFDNLGAVSRQLDRSTSELEIHAAGVSIAEDAASQLVSEIDELYEDRQHILDHADDALSTAISNLKKEIRDKRIEDDRIKRQQAERASQAPGKAGGAAPSVTPGFQCPVLGGASFSNTWGARRSGGRTHKGVDMFNARHTPLVAVVDGRVKFSSNSLGGLSTHIYSDNGVVYYYAHLQSHPTNIKSGQRVNKGDIVGYLGNSGNARYTSPHLHFEIRPNGVAVNPYPTVRASC